MQSPADRIGAAAEGGRSRCFDLVERPRMMAQRLRTLAVGEVDDCWTDQAVNGARLLC